MNSEATLETDSLSPYSDSQFQCADSNTETVVPEPSTVSDQSDNFESQTAPEPY